MSASRPVAVFESETEESVHPDMSQPNERKRHKQMMTLPPSNPEHEGWQESDVSHVVRVGANMGTSQVAAQ